MNSGYCLLAPRKLSDFDLVACVQEESSQLSVTSICVSVRGSSPATYVVRSVVMSDVTPNKMFCK